MANPQAGRQTHFAPFTGLRFVLALWVILHHLTGHGQMLEGAALALPRVVYVLIRGGYLAVTTSSCFRVLCCRGVIARQRGRRATWRGTGRGGLRGCIPSTC